MTGSARKASGRSRPSGRWRFFCISMRSASVFSERIFQCKADPKIQEALQMFEGDLMMELELEGRVT